MGRVRGCGLGRNWGGAFLVLMALGSLLQTNEDTFSKFWRYQKNLNF